MQNQKDRINAYITALKAYETKANVYSANAYSSLDFHVMDALTLGGLIETTEHIVDLGSGSGLPSVILSIMHPESQIYAVESKEKKVQFLHHLKSTLALPNFHPLHTDALSVMRQIKQGAQQATALTAKAFMPPEKLAKTLQPFYGKIPLCYVPISQKQTDTLGNLPIPHHIIQKETYRYLVLGAK